MGLAENDFLLKEDTWNPARLIPTVGIKGQDEQEKRATSSLLSVMQAVPAFGYTVLKELKPPKGKINTYTEIRLEDEEGNTHIPDGAIVIKRGQSVWRCLVEVKTSSSRLEVDQVSRYLAIAKEHQFDAVLTISNEITGSAQESPLSVPKRLTKRTPLYHLSWWKIYTEAIVQHRHRGVDDTDQAWILNELILYLDHPNSGANGFEDMGENWVKVRTAVSDGTLTTNDPEAQGVIARWGQFIHYLCLKLSQELGQEVTPYRQRSKAPKEHADELAKELVDTGVVSAVIKVPNAVKPISIKADLRTRKVETSIMLPAPQAGRPSTRINWLLKQLKHAPDSLRVEVLFTNTKEVTSLLLGEVRNNTDKLLSSIDPKRTPREFRLTLVHPMGIKRGKGAGSFIAATRDQTIEFYRDLVQDLQAWHAPAPQIPSSDSDLKASDFLPDVSPGMPLLPPAESDSQFRNDTSWD